MVSIRAKVEACTAMPNSPACRTHGNGHDSHACAHAFIQASAQKLAQQGLMMLQIGEYLVHPTRGRCGAWGGRCTFNVAPHMLHGAGALHVCTHVYWCPCMGTNRGIVEEIDWADARDKPYRILYDNGEQHCYSTASTHGHVQRHAYTCVDARSAVCTDTSVQTQVSICVCACVNMRRDVCAGKRAEASAA